MSNNIKVISNRILLIRKIMIKNNIDCFYVPHHDENLLEEVPEYNNRLNWISGFDGSAGNFLLFKKEAHLFVDGRYTLQAKIQLKDINLMIHDISVKSMLSFLEDKQIFPKVFAIDSKTISVRDFQILKKVINKRKAKIKILKSNIIDIAWKREKKDFDKKILFLNKKYVGKSYSEKVKYLLKKMKQEKLDYLFIQDSASVAWLTNMRGFSLKYTPILFCYALLGLKKSFLFFKKIPEEILNSDISKDFSINTLDDFENVLKQINTNKKSILIDTTFTSEHFFRLLKRHFKDITFGDDMIKILKAIKNNQEILSFKKAHLLDGISLCKFICWFKSEKGRFSEINIVQKLLKLRKENSSYLCNSFPTIAALNSNAAIIHYSPKPKTSKISKKKDILLLDSGGQYKHGTTDVTRTISKGNHPKKIKLDYTVVLKAHIQINLTRFPLKTPASFLDSIARNKMFEYGMDFAHSTGHGVGFCLNVHEAPPNISKFSKVELKEGMVFSNEPGFYKSNSHGIRIENLVYIKKNFKKYKEFLEIESLTLVPYERDLILDNLLSEKEKKWLNMYNKIIYKKISPFLNKKEKNWLSNNCRKFK